MVGSIYVEVRTSLSLRWSTAGDLKAALARQAWDLIISDYNMPGFKGTDALHIVRSQELDVPFIFVKYWDWFNIFSPRVKNVPEAPLTGDAQYQQLHTMWIEE